VTRYRFRVDLGVREGLEKVSLTRLLITGANGFIGRHATELAAEKGLDVHALGSRMPLDPVEGVTYHVADLISGIDRACALVREIAPTHLLHLAWYAVPRVFWTALENYRWPGATMELVSAFADAGGTRLVAAGTCAEYDWTSGICVEGVTPLDPKTPYGVSKDATRRLLESWANRRDVRFAWGRVFFVYGPGEHPDRVVASVVRALLRGQTANCTDGRQVRDFLHVRDAAAAFLALTQSVVEGAVNIASGEPVPLATLLTRAGDELGARSLIAFGALPSPGEPPLVAGDTRRLRQEVGFEPLHDLQSGLRDTIEWHRAQFTQSGASS